MFLGRVYSQPLIMCQVISGNRRGMTISVTILGIAILVVLLAYFSFSDINNDKQLDSLRFAGIIFRHGDRSPTDLYPLDPYLNYSWPGGLGALSKKGSYQMYKLGDVLRKRYYKLMPSDGLYSKEELYVLSSAAERCLMSAAAFLAGFMPPQSHNNHLPISWQPIPINSLPRDRDYLLAQKKPCPKYDDLLEELTTIGNEDIQRINKDNADLYAYLTKNTGKKVSNILGVEYLYNTLEVEQLNGLKLPEWTADVFPQRMLPLAERYLALITETDYMKKIKGGALLTEILDNMIKKRDAKLLPNRNIFLYSAHDVTLLNLMRTLNISDQTSTRPDYGATLAMELHQNDLIGNDDLEIKIVYYFNATTGKPPKMISIPNCNTPCALGNFTKTVDNFILRDYDRICQK